MNFQNYLKYLLAAFTFIICATAQARDTIFLNHLALQESKSQISEFGFGLPPIGTPPVLMIGNSFTIREWKDELYNFSTFRWSPSFINKLDEKRTLMLVNSFTWSSEKKSDLFTYKSLSSTLIANILNRNEASPQWMWSYGLLVFDRTNFKRVYPIAGFNYTDDEKKWRYSVGYPNVGITYLGLAPDEVAVIFHRENSKSLLDKAPAQNANAEYIHESLNLIGLSYKATIKEIYRITLRAGRSFASKFQYLDKDFSPIDTYIDHSAENYISFSMSLDFSPAKNR